MQCSANRSGVNASTCGVAQRRTAPQRSAYGLNQPLVFRYISVLFPSLRAYFLHVDRE